MTRRLIQAAALLAGLALMAALGCVETRKTVKQGDQPLRPCPVKVMALAPFLAAKPATDGVGMVCPVTGDLFPGKAVPATATYELTARLPKAVEAVMTCVIVTPLAFSGQMPAQPAVMGTPVRQALAQAGRKSGAEAVLAGVIYRWEERDGTDLGVNRPASVSFGFYLIESGSGRIAWRSSFTGTDKALSQNLLLLPRFLSQGARWLTAAEFAGYAISDVVARMPLSLEE